MITRTVAKMNTAAIAAKAKASGDVIVENEVDEVVANDKDDNTTSIVSTLTEALVINEVTTEPDEDDDSLKRHYISSDQKAIGKLPFVALNVSEKSIALSLMYHLLTP